MMISTKGRYALRMMLDIAQQPPGSVITLKDIAARQEISLKYLESIALLLSRSGFLKSMRGPRGGYSLTRTAEEYTVGEILRLAEGNLAPVSCLADPSNICPRNDRCVTLPFWKGLNERINSYVDSYTLAELAAGIEK